MHGSHDSSSSSSNKLQALEVAILVLLAFLSSSPSSSSWVRAATLGEVGQHATPEDCWSAVYGNVYDLTGYAPNHRRGGGPSAVYKMCGIDGTDLFDDYHSDNKEWLDEISSIQNLGPLIEEETDPPTDPPLPASPATDPPLVPTDPPVTETPPTDPPLPATDPPAVATEPPVSDTPPPVVVVITEPPAPEPTVVPTEPPVLAPPSEPPVVLPTITTSPTKQTGSEGILISIEELSKHNISEDCWVSYYGDVYEMSEYAPTHPAGSGIILANCGLDGTEEYAEYHEQSLLASVQEYYVGKLDPEAVFDDESTVQPQELTAVSLEELAQHNSTKDCWVCYYDEVYDLTTYGHPGRYGMSVIYMSCGKDGTRNYTAVHPRDYLEDVEHLKVGWLESASVPIKGIGSAIVLASLVHFFSLGM